MAVASRATSQGAASRAFDVLSCTDTVRCSELLPLEAYPQLGFRTGRRVTYWPCAVRVDEEVLGTARRRR